MLDQVNVEKMENIVVAYLEEENVNINPLLKQWERGKEKIYKLFGDKLTIEREFDSILGEDDIYDKFRQFRWQNDYISYPVKCYLSTLSSEELAKNICLQPYCELEGYKRGQKLSKYLNYLMKLEDIPEFGVINDKVKSKSETFSNNFSMFLQSLKFKGVMVISIDPIDYLTMSVNASNWESCHSYEGCHNAGMFSYMADDCTAIAYVKSIEDVDYNINGVEFTHNTKKWRQVVYIDVDALSTIFSRQYPAENANALNEAKALISDQFATIYNINNKYKVIEDRDEIVGMVSDKNHLHYNDITNTDRECECLIMNGGFEPSLYVGEHPYCPMCGEHRLESEDYMRCRECRTNYEICSECGGRHPDYNMYHHQGSAYCQACFNREFESCERCGRYERKGNLINIKSDDRKVCRRCIDNLYMNCTKCNELTYHHNLHSYDGNYYCFSCYLDARHINKREGVV